MVQPIIDPQAESAGFTTSARSLLTARLPDLESCPRRSSVVQGHAVGDELVLYDPAQEAAISLNVSAAAVWESCDGLTTLAEIVDSIAELLDVPRSAIAADLARAAGDLLELGLLELVEENPIAGEE